MTKAGKKGHRFLFIFGARPEAIKLAPLVLRLREIGDVRVCERTSQGDA